MTTTEERLLPEERELLYELTLEIGKCHSLPFGMTAAIAETVVAFMRKREADLRGRLVGVDRNETA